MAIHDYVIANQSGAAFRTDLNNALAAIVSNNSSSTEPTTKYAYQWWADTNTGILKIRNSANDGWVELLQLDGTLTLEDGSASTPALAFRDDLDTGIYSDAANTFKVATGGVERMSLGAETVFNESGANVDFRIEGDTASDTFFVDAGNNRVGIGTSSPNSELHVDGDLTITSNQPKIFLTDNNNNSDFTVQNANGNFSVVDETNSATRLYVDSSGNVGIGTTSPTAASGETTLHINANEYPELHLTSSVTGANAGDGSIFTLNNDSSTIIRNQENSYIRFDTNGSNERMRITSDGNVKINDGDLIIGTAGHGIDFSASANNGGMTSEILNDYERGTFTATCSGIGGGTNPTFSAQTSSATYIKVGDVVHYWIYIFDINCTNSGSGIIMVVTGLPFASGGHYYPGVVTHNTVIGSGNVNAGYVGPNLSTPHFIPIVGNSTNGAVANTGNPLYIMIGGAYTSTVV